MPTHTISAYHTPTTTTTTTAAAASAEEHVIALAGDLVTIDGDLTVTGTAHVAALDAATFTTPTLHLTGDLTVDGTSHLGIVESASVITPSLTLNGTTFTLSDNDYTPTVIGGPGYSVTYTSQTGHYIKVGRLVKAYFDIKFNGTITGPLLTPLRITLPFNNGYDGQTGTLSTLCQLPTPPAFPITFNLRQAGVNYGALFANSQPNSNPIMPQTGMNQRLVGSISFLAPPYP